MTACSISGAAPASFYRESPQSTRTRIRAGVDPVAEMLEIAGRKLGDRARLRVGYANALPWPDASFDTVVSCNMFHYVTHPAPSLLEIKRVLHPGGTLVITDWCDDYFACRLCNIYLRMTNRAYYKTYRQRECGDLLRAAGFGKPGKSSATRSTGFGD